MAFETDSSPAQCRKPITGCLTQGLLRNRSWNWFWDCDLWWSLDVGVENQKETTGRPSLSGEFFLISWFFFDLKMFIKLPSSQSSMALPKWKIEKMMFLLDSVVGWCECIPKKESFRVKGVCWFGWKNVSARNIKMGSSSTWPYTVDSMVWYDANHRNGSIFHLKTKKRWKPDFFALWRFGTCI